MSPEQLAKEITEIVKENKDFRKIVMKEAEKEKKRLAKEILSILDGGN